MSLSIDTEVKGIGALLKAGRLRVPHHQRAFAWTNEDVGQLWDDITRAENQESGYFVGPVVLGEEAPRSPLSVIDGQQRLATASLLFAAIAGYFIGNGGEPGSERAQILDNEYLGSKNLVTLERDPRLVLNGDDDEYFRQLISAAVSSEQPPEPQTQKPSHRLLFDAFKLLSDRVMRRAEGSGSNWQSSLQELVGFVAESVQMITIKVGNSHNAYLIFETLNSRGAQLTTSDLLKNHLFGQAEGRLDQVRIDWTEMTAGLATIEGRESTPDFLRHYWISTREMVREKDLFKIISTEIRTSRLAAQLSTGLAKSAQQYASLANPSHPNWRSTAVRESLQVLQLFRVKTPRPLLLAASEELPDNQFQRVLAAVARWSVRLAIVGGLGSGTAEEIFGEAARDVRRKKIKSVSTLKDCLKTIIPSDQDFLGAFANKRIKNGRQSRYLLAELEKQARGQAQEVSELTTNLDENRVNLEHVMPRNSKAWSIDDHSLYVDRIGNMALMLAKVNRRQGDDTFESKKEAFRRSKLILTRSLAQFPSWGPDQIAERQQHLANLAVKAWPR